MLTSLPRSRLCGLALVAALSAFGTAQVAQASDSSTVEVIGFSKDGKYLAFEQYGIYDGSGFPFDQIDFVDVAKNVYAAKEVYVSLETDDAASEVDSVAHARRLALLQAKPALAMLGIVAGNRGEQVVSRLLTDGDAAQSKEARFSLNPEGYRRFGIQIRDNQTIPAPERCFSEQGAKLLSVDFLNFDGDDSVIATRNIQQDTSVPKWRQCAFDYSVASVSYYDPNPTVWNQPKTYKLAAFVWVTTPGFEGLDHRAMVVTSEFTYPQD